MENLKNWLLPLSMVFSAFLIEYNDLIHELLLSVGADQKYYLALKIGMGLVSAIILKLQHPNISKKEKSEE